MIPATVIYILIPTVPLLVVLVVLSIFLSKDAYFSKGLYGTKGDVIDEIFYGGWKWLRNVFCLGVTVSNIFSPCLLAESLYVTEMQAINLIIARTLAFWMCVLLWYRINGMGYQSIPCYISERFQSQLMLNLYYLNSLCGLYYIYLVYNGPLVFSAMELFKTSIYFQLIFFAFIVVCSFGGMRAVIVICTFLLPIEFIGSSLLMMKLPHSSIAPKFASLYENCFSCNPFVSFASTICILMSVQPAYPLFYAASSKRTALISMAMGNLIFIIRSVVALIYSIMIKNDASLHEVMHYRWLWASLKYPDGINSTISEFILDSFLKQTSVRDYHTALWDLGETGLFIINACLFAPLTMFYCLRIVLLSCEVIEKITPYLITSRIISIGNDLQRMYAAVHCVLAAIFFKSWIDFQENVSMPSSRNFDLYIPKLHSLLMPGITIIVMLGGMFPRARLFPMICGWIIALVLGAFGDLTIIFRKEPSMDVSDCINAWNSEETNDFWWLCLTSWSWPLYWCTTLCFILLFSVLFDDIKGWLSDLNWKINTASMATPTSMFSLQSKSSLYATYDLYHHYDLN